MLTIEETAKVKLMYFYSDCTWVVPRSSNDNYMPVDDKGMILDLIVSANGDVYPELKNLSAITDEHAVELGKIYYGNQAVSKKDMIADVKMFLRVSNFPLNYDHFWWKAYQYLISKSYAVPLFFGIDHPCNGKTAIECGIAIIKQ